MNTHKICLKWLNDDVKQIELEIFDGKQPVKIICPMSGGGLPDGFEPEDADKNPLFRARNLLAEICCDNKDIDNNGIYSGYGILKDNSSILACLICWPINERASHDGEIVVKSIPDKARQVIVERIREMAGYWQLTTQGNKCSAKAFAEYAVKNYRWIFDFNITQTTTSISRINRDALELEWYWVNGDKQSFERKRNQLVDKVGSYVVCRYCTNIKTYGKFIGGEVMGGKR